MIFLLITIITIKFTLFYKFLDSSMESIGLISSVSVFYLIFLYYMLNRIFKKNIKWFLIIYILINLLLLGNLIHYKYFSRYLSIGLLSQLRQLPSVSGSIKEVFKLKYLIIFLDIPILYFILLRVKERKYKGRKAMKKLVLIFLISIIIFANIPLDNNAIKVIQSREVLTHHIQDIFQNIKDNIRYDEISMENLNNKEENSSAKKLFGVGKGRNLIVIQVESLQDMVINRYYEGQEITPALNSLIKGDTIYFPHYYQQLAAGNTSDAEFVSQNSLYPSIKGQSYTIYKDNYYFGLPWILKNEGYETMAFHGNEEEYWNRNKAYPYQGFNGFISEKDFTIDEKIGFGLSDKSFFKQSNTYLEDLKQPFYTFFITLTNHGPFNIPINHQKIKIKPEHESTLFSNYLQSVRYTDEAIRQFIEDLKEKGLYNNSVIAIYGDHFGISCKDKNNYQIIRNFLGYDYDYDEMMNVPLIIHIPGENIHRKLEITGGQIDFMPTIINLMGIESTNPFVFGQDLVNGEEGFVASQTYMVTGSFINNDIIFEMSRDGIYENSRAWNLHTRESVELDTCREYYERALEEVRMSDYILENDVLRYELRKGKDIIIEIFNQIFY